jgi:hypothetical protein
MGDDGSGRLGFKARENKNSTGITRQALLATHCAAVVFQVRQFAKSQSRNVYIAQILSPSNAATSTPLTPEACVGAPKDHSMRPALPIL